MYTSGMVSVVIPSRNEPYLRQTCEDLIRNARGPIEVIVILDGYWPDPKDIVKDVIYIHNENPRGMRDGINSGVAIAKGEFILKSDAHCMFSESWDLDLKTPYQENQVVVPRRYPLDPEKWAIEERSDNKYPVDYMYLSQELHGEPWPEKREERRNVMIDDLMSAQGSCWFMSKKYYEFLELLDEEKYGTFFSEFQEIGLKAWLSGGEVKVNKYAWYAHWHKPKDVGRGYSLAKGEKEKATAEVEKWRVGSGWIKQTKPLSWLIQKFGPVPGWDL
jgi:glycosyltransferase involved in cell wall biosynthesis